MEGEDKKQKFYDAVIRMLYPPPPPPPEEDKPESVNTSTHNLNLDQILADSIDDESEGPTSSSDGDESEDEGDGPKKMTRAQRKRLRKKLLKQAASQERRKMIGPMQLASTTACEGAGDAIENEPQGVRRNAAQGIDSLVSEPESKEIPSGSKPNKRKQRRMAKKMACDTEKISSSGKSNQEKEDP